MQWDGLDSVDTSVELCMPSGINIIMFSFNCSHKYIIILIQTCNGCSYAIGWIGLDRYISGGMHAFRNKSSCFHSIEYRFKPVMDAAVP